MTLAIEAVVKQLADSGIVAQGKLENFVPPKAFPKDVDELVRELVKQHHLTKFQAQQVAAGKAKALILGSYTIVDRIGAGGMGQVFKAEHRRMKRTVAIKTLPASTMKDAAAVARFQREVEAAAKLEHPHIVTAHDADQAGNTHFLVMQYVEGQDLSARVKKHGPLPVAEAVNYTLQAARGLEYAHKKGVIHRDIKPANLLLDAEGTVKILDMGLARINADGNDATQAELTGTGAVMGTVDYMAPEQARSTRHVDGRADIYSLGCSLYYLLTGRPLYDGETMTAKLIAHQCDPIPRLSDARSDVPEELEAVYQRMVAKTPDERYQTMSEVIAALSSVLPSALTARGELSRAGEGPGVRGNEPSSGSNSNLSFLKETAAPTTLRKSGKQTAKDTHKPAALSKRNLLIGGGGLAVALVLGIFWVMLGGKHDDEAARIDVPADGAAAVTAPPEGENAAGTPDASSPGGYILSLGKGETAVEMPSLNWPLTGPVTIEAYITANETPTHSYHLAGIEGQLALIEQGGGWGFSIGATKAKKGFPLNDRAPIQLGTRTHLAGVYTGNSLHLFVNGTRVGSVKTDNEPLPESTKTFRIGGKFAAVMEELRVSLGAMYSENFTPRAQLTATPSTLALYRFDQSSGEVVPDLSGHEHHGKIISGKWVRRSSVSVGIAETSPEASTESIATPVAPALSPHGLLASPDYAWSTPERLPSGLNTSHHEQDACLSYHGLTLWFATDRPGTQGGHDIFAASRTSLANKWSVPKSIFDDDVNSSAMELGPTTMTDGLTLLFHSDRHGGKGGMDLWMSKRETTSDPFQSLIAPGPLVNSNWYEFSPTLSSDGLELIYHSGRSGGVGKGDLWACRRTSTAEEFGSPFRLSTLINTPEVEYDPCLSSDGRVLLFFSSRDYDVKRCTLWMSTRESNGVPWNSPVRLKINPPTDQGQFGPALSTDGSELYFHINNEQTKNDLWVTRRVPKK